jgi:uncharacterized membrane protein
VVQRLIETVITYERLVKGAFDKIRQAGRGMPAVYIRELQNLEKILQYVVGDEQRDVIVGHADMILRASESPSPSTTIALTSKRPMSWWLYPPGALSGSG